MQRCSGRLVPVVVGALLISLLATGVASPVQRAEAAIVPCSSLQWGTYLTNAPLDSSMASLRGMDTTIDRHTTIVHWYTQWGASWGTWAYNHPLFDNMHNYNSVSGAGATPLLTWEAWGSPFTVTNNQFPLTSIAAGNFDAYIDSWAVGLHSWGYPVMLDVFHEMDGNWYPWGYNVNGNNQAAYIAAYRHVHDRFALAGATNVQFVWNPDAWNPAGVDQRTFYPGDAYVDWMAIDVYNWGHAAGTWESLTQLLSDMQIYNKLAALSSKPMMFAEWGTAEPVAGDPAGVTKGQWIIDSAQALGSQFTRIKAVVWFSENGGVFALDSSSNSLAGAKTAFGSCNSGPPPASPVPSPLPSPKPSPLPSPKPSPVASPSPHPSPSPSPRISPSPSPRISPSPSPRISPSPSPRTSPSASPSASPSPAPRTSPSTAAAAAHSPSTSPTPKPKATQSSAPPAGAKSGQNAPPASPGSAPKPAPINGSPSAQLLAAFVSNDAASRVAVVAFVVAILMFVALAGLRAVPSLVNLSRGRRRRP
jgi:glycosyl hydrolase family 26